MKPLLTYELPPPPCVYFLYREGSLVYVGKTTDLRSRIKAHLRDKSFDAVQYTPVDEEKLELVEAAYILLHRPPLNIAIPGVDGDIAEILAGYPDPKLMALSVRPLPQPERRKRKPRTPEPIPPECTGFLVECICDGDRSFDGYCEPCECGCEACELRDFDYDLYEAVYILGTKKLKAPPPMTEADRIEIRKALDKLCAKVPVDEEPTP